MNPHALYPFINYGSIAPWALLVFAPRWRWTQRLVHGAVVPLLLCAAYAILFVSTMSGLPADAGGATLDGVMRMFDVPWLVLVCWIHYIAFDLFVGAWMARDAVRLDLPHLALAPCLLVTQFFGPAGLLVYLVVRYALRRRLTLHELSA